MQPNQSPQGGNLQPKTSPGSPDQSRKTRPQDEIEKRPQDEIETGPEDDTESSERPEDDPSGQR
jgi:hypothetical protein